MISFEIKDRYGLSDLVELVRILRDPVDGCPWDKVQTHESIRQNFIEETYEAAEAIDKKDGELLKEELGDVLLQVLLHSEIESSLGGFDIDDVATGICKKLVLRHPHIFGDVTAKDSGTVLANWEDIKRKEKHQKSGADSVLDVPKALPALMRSQKVQKRAAYVGFDYEDVGGAFAGLLSEADELKTAIEDKSNFEEEIGDLIFAAVNVARFLKVDAELALTRACDKFTDRFVRLEQLAKERGIDTNAASAEQLDGLWREVKSLSCSNTAMS